MHKTLSIDVKKAPPQMEKIFKIMAPDKRISKVKMQQYLAKRYKGELAKNIVEILTPSFGNFLQNLDFGLYVGGINAIFNKSEYDLKKDLAFKIFDMNSDGKVSEEDMFNLMLNCGGQKGGFYKQPRDLFLS